MRLLCFLTLTFAAALIFNGCAATMPSPGGTMPGMLYTGITIPVGMTIDQVYAAYPDSFTVIGMVEGTASATNILYIVNIGNAGLANAIDDAKSQVDADGLINCVFDTKGSSILGLFGTQTTIVRGLAIKRKK